SIIIIKMNNMRLYETNRGVLTGRSVTLSDTTFHHKQKDKVVSSFNRYSVGVFYTWLISIFKEIFLPAGYPDSVSRDYLPYQKWDTLQAFTSSITNALAFSAILEGMGVGDEKASVLSATFVWLIKDGVGMFGRIMFAWLHGTDLDRNLKMWRFYADILNDLATSIDLLAPYYKSLLLPITCCSNLCRSLVGVAGGSTRAALTQHQALNNNMGDVSAKDGSQETLVNLVALICNLFILKTIKQDRLLVWTLYVLLTCLHLYANYRAIRTLNLKMFNWNRYVIATGYYFQHRIVPSIEFVNRTEPLLYEIRQNITCNIGIEFRDHVDD
ncbi:unnamed protein product, partial [Didymodactylos carnosus]